MRVADAMTRDVQIASCDQSILDIAKMMADLDCGVLPVGENDRLVGMITDRDIVVRALARGKNVQTKVRDVMSEEVKYCYEDDQLENVARNMADLQVRRLPVLNKEKRLVGIVALGDIATNEDQCAAKALSGISESASQRSSGQLAH